MEEHVYPNEAQVHREMQQPDLPWRPSPTIEALKQKAKASEETPFFISYFIILTIIF